jgi:hypothetical protein
MVKLVSTQPAHWTPVITLNCVFQTVYFWTLDWRGEYVSVIADLQEQVFFSSSSFPHSPWAYPSSCPVDTECYLSGITAVAEQM